MENYFKSAQSHKTLENQGKVSFNKPAAFANKQNDIGRNNKRRLSFNTEKNQYRKKPLIGIPSSIYNIQGAPSYYSYKFR